MEIREEVLRVERGRADDEELAAVAAVLLALCRDREPVESEEPAEAGSDWWRRRDAYRAPASWR
ncbi:MULTISPECIES: acyl-CoA carboxylase epsilon subunit [unclassified Streptomyces]|uniref:acyl-CoA carboxylase epsilon subunit n=1 Tax=unclassified Streptomyces TaxID=2593676 RepID=UPI0033C777BC